MFRSLRNARYRAWFLGSFMSNTAFWAQSTVIGWIVLTDFTENDATAVGYALALQFGPQVLLAPLTGHLTDRYDRRRILQLTQLAWTLLGAVMGALLLLGTAQLWHVFVFMALFGTVNAFDAPARQAYVSDLVPSAHVANAVALNSASFNASRLIGPGLAGLLIAVIGPGPVFLSNALAYVGLFAVLCSIKEKGAEARSRRTIGATEAEPGAIRYLLSRSDFLGILVIALLVGAFGMNFPIISSAMTLELGGDVAQYGVFSSLLGAGSMAGALYTARRTEISLRFIAATGGLFALAYAVAATMPNSFAFGVAVIPVGFFLVALVSSLNAYVQITCVPRLRGRVLAIYLGVLFAGAPVGGPIAGHLCDALGARWGFGAASIAAAIACAIGVLLFLRHRRRPGNGEG